MIGRTHGVHAEPTTFGAKVALWCLQADRDRARLRAARDGGGRRQAVGRGRHVLQHRPGGRAPRVRRARADAGAGHAGRGPRPPRRVPVGVRRRSGATVELIAVELRHLQRTEVREVEEGFQAGPEGLVGHAPQAQPDHRRAAVPAWPASCGATSRPASRTSRCGTSGTSRTRRVERVILPDSSLLAYYVLRRAASLVAGLRVDADRMLANLWSSHGLVFSQPVLLALVAGGLSRDDAYRIVQERRHAGVGGGRLVPGAAGEGRAGARVGGRRARRGLLLERSLRHIGARRSTRSTPSRRDRSMAPALPARAPGQGARPLRRRRRPAPDGGVRPAVGLRRGDGRARARQGPGAHGHERVLVRAARRRSPATTSCRPTLAPLPADAPATPGWPGA